MNPEYLALVCLAFIAGGILKGAIGAGAPVLAVPIMVILFDVQFAVAVFVIPNFMSNAWQIWKFRDWLKGNRFALIFAFGGGIGAGLGTLALAGMDGRKLTMSVALVVLLYVAFRLLNPSWKLPLSTGRKVALPVGVVAGMLQGATGLSAPVSMTFMSSIDLARQLFVAGMSLFFITMALIQLPVQLSLGIMTQERFVYSLLATVPLLLGMPIGTILVRFISPRVFDRIVLVVLTLLALRLLIN